MKLAVFYHPEAFRGFALSARLLVEHGRVSANSHTDLVHFDFDLQLRQGLAGLQLGLEGFPVLGHQDWRQFNVDVALFDILVPLVNYPVAMFELLAPFGFGRELLLHLIVVHHPF